MSSQIQTVTSESLVEDAETTTFAATSEQQFTINLMLGCTDTKPVQETGSWGPVCSLFTERPTTHGKLSLAEYQAADHEARRRDKDHWGWIPGSLTVQSLGRKQENIDKLHFIVLDCDDGFSFDEAVQKLDGYEAVIHTTYSHTAEKPKLRAIMPLAESIQPSQAAAFFNLMQAHFDGKLDTSCLEHSRFFYLPACPADAVDLFQAQHLTGRMLSLADVIPATLPTAIPTASKPTAAASSPALTLATVDGIAVGGRNTELARHVGHLVKGGNDLERATDLSLTWNAKLAEPLTEFEVRRTVKSIFKTAERKAALSEGELEKIIVGMNRSYAFISDSARIVRLDDRSIQTKEQMRDRYSNSLVLTGPGGSSKHTTHFQAWFDSPARREHIGFTFQPGQGLIADNHINLWTGWGATPVAGDVKPWEDMLDFLFGAGTEARTWICQWIAYPLQFPGTKLKAAAVMWSSRQGVGKSLLGQTIGRLYGNHAKTISARELHDKNNSWAEDALFVLGEENSGSDRRADSNRLKQLITEDTMYIEEKYQVRHVAPNMLNFMFTSNHADAFHLEIHDRRYFVSAIDAAPKSSEFYTDFVKWRDSPAGMSALMDHLLKLDLTGFDPHGHEPMSKAKAEMIEHSKTEVERWITDAVSDDYIDKHLCSEIVSLNELVEHYHREVGSGKTNTTALGKALRRQCNYEQKRLSMGKLRFNAISLRRHEYWRDQSGEDWAIEYAKGKKASIGIFLP